MSDYVNPSEIRGWFVCRLDGLYYVFVKTNRRGWFHTVLEQKPDSRWLRKHFRNSRVLTKTDARIYKCTYGL
jgi:hypothetical protein